MKVVSENSDRDLARKRAIEEVERSIRMLAANCLRVVRGAGDADNLGMEAKQFVDALLHYHEKVGYWPPSEELRTALEIDSRPRRAGREANEEFDDSYAREIVIHGALRVAAPVRLQAASRTRCASRIPDGQTLADPCHSAGR